MYSSIMQSSNLLGRIITGDFFAVTRGFPLNLDNADGIVHYERSHEGVIYRALEVCGPLIAAESVYADELIFTKKPGTIHSINTNEVEVCPLTPEYVQAMTSKEQT